MHGSGEPAGPCGQDRARWAVVSCGLQQLPLGPPPDFPRLSLVLPLQGLPFCRCLVAVPVVRRLPRPPRTSLPSQPWVSLGQRQPRAFTSACAR